MFQKVLQAITNSSNKKECTPAAAEYRLATQYTLLPLPHTSTSRHQVEDLESQAGNRPEYSSEGSPPTEKTHLPSSQPHTPEAKSKGNVLRRFVFPTPEAPPKVNIFRTIILHPTTPLWAFLLIWTLPPLFLSECTQYRPEVIALTTMARTLSLSHFFTFVLNYILGEKFPNMPKETHGDRVASFMGLCVIFFGGVVFGPLTYLIGYGLYDECLGRVD
ncbi:MAG: hypothetical protein Q9208_003529 [Pyrenodesmia sp. 3 TL-2023]